MSGETGRLTAAAVLTTEMVQHIASQGTLVLNRELKAVCDSHEVLRAALAEAQRLQQVATNRSAELLDRMADARSRGSWTSTPPPAPPQRAEERKRFTCGVCGRGWNRISEAKECNHAQPPAAGDGRGR